MMVNKLISKIKNKMKIIEIVNDKNEINRENNKCLINLLSAINKRKMAAERP